MFNYTFKNMQGLIKRKIGYVYLFLMFLTSGITTVFIKMLLMERLNPYHILTYTSFIGLITLVLFNYKKGIKGFVKSDLSIKWLVIAAITGFSLYEISFNIALEYMSVSQTIIIYYSYPIFLYLAGVIFLKEGSNRKIKKSVIAGILMSFMGVYFVLTGGKLLIFSINTGIFYILISIVSITVFTILGKKREIPELQFLFMGQAVAFILGIFILTVQNWWIVPDFRELFYIIFIAIVYNIINMVFYLKTIQFLSVEKLTTLMYASPIVTSGLAVLILKEPLLTTTVIGLILVMLGNLIANKKES